MDTETATPNGPLSKGQDTVGRPGLGLDISPCPTGLYHGTSLMSRTNVRVPRTRGKSPLAGGLPTVVPPRRPSLSGRKCARR